MSDLNNGMKTIKNKSEGLYDAVKENAENTYQDVKPKAEELFSKVCTTTSDVYQSSKEKISQAEDYIEDSINSFNETIRKQPLPAVLIAAGIGFFLARFRK